MEPRAERVYTLDEVASAMRVSRSTLRRRVADGSVRVIRLGRAVRVGRSELARLLGEI